MIQHVSINYPQGAKAKNLECYFRIQSRTPLLEKTLLSVFVKDKMNNVTCSLPTVTQQARCFADPGIQDVMRHAIQLVETCREIFMYEPWQCTTTKAAFKKGANPIIQSILNLSFIICRH